MTLAGKLGVQPVDQHPEPEQQAQRQLEARRLT
jgi:hypothetical protein